jgi:hypothetical protein
MPTVPLISSGVAGPLGVLHLPRFWQKVVLKATGNLHGEYPECGGGFDAMVLGALGLDKDKTLAYLHKNVPSYPEFEKWILDQKGGKLDAKAVADFNAAASGYNHDDATRKSILDGAGIKDDGSIKDAVHLNQLEDWTAFHKSRKK